MDLEILAMGPNSSWPSLFLHLQYTFSHALGSRAQALEVIHHRYFWYRHLLPQLSFSSPSICIFANFFVICPIATWMNPTRFLCLLFFFFFFFFFWFLFWKKGVVLKISTWLFDLKMIYLFPEDVKKQFIIPLFCVPVMEERNWSFVSSSANFFKQVRDESGTRILV